MKTRICWNWSLLLTLVLLPLAGCMQRAAKSADPGVVATTEAPAVTIADTDQEESTDFDSVADTETSDASVTPVSGERSVPLNLRPDSPLAEAIKLASSGVEEGVILAFVTNSTSTFNLSSAEIIYLNDIGMPGSVISAMIQRDHMLQQNPADNLLAQTPLDQAPAAPLIPEPQPVVPEVAANENYEFPEADYSDFYGALAPYGNWVDVAGYGQCWQPTVVAVNSDWRPYCDRGHWVNTDCGWYWLSDYSWGWAPFHYGRWFRHEHLGWCWTPDRVWGPAWVSWRYSHDYCGWAPLPPAARYVAGLGLTFRGRPVGIAFNFGIGAEWFTFVSLGSFTDNHLAHHTLPRDQIQRIYPQTVPSTRITTSNNHLVNHGVPAERVAAVTQRPVHRAIVRQITALADGARPERIAPDGGTLTVYRGSLAASVAPTPRRPDAPAPMRSLSPPAAPGFPTDRAWPAVAATPVNRLHAEATLPNSVIIIGHRGGNPNSQRPYGSSGATAAYPVSSPPENSGGETPYSHASAPPGSSSHPAVQARPERPYRHESPAQLEARLTPPPPVAVPQPVAQPHQSPPPAFQPPAEPPRFVPPPAHVPEHVHSAPPPPVESHQPPPPAPAPAPAASSSHDHSSSSGRGK